MDPYNDPNHRRNNSTPHSFIPLQDLSSTPPDDEDAQRTTRRRSRTLEGRNLLSNRTSFPRVGNNAYAPIAEASPSPTRRRTGGIRVITDNAPDNTQEPASAVDGAAFQEAMGFAGLSFQGETSGPSTSRPYYGRSGSVPSLLTQESELAMEPQDLEDREAFSPPYGDTTPLTNTNYLQPMGAPGPSTPSGQRHDRNRSNASVRFSPVADRASGGMLGDDLANAEAGLHTPSDGVRRSSSLRRSLTPSSTSSPLARAGTMVRNMSQRIVNVSNEPTDQVVERARRKSSVRQPRPSISGVLPPVVEYGVDGPSTEMQPVEKVPSNVTASPVLVPTRTPSPSPLPFPNPLRGKSLGIFPPDSKIRIKLCDLLVHPVTEPFILVLIIFQTVLLAVEAGPSVYNDPRSETWGRTWIDYALLVLFIIYTAETVIRIIVSGFIINPAEYSTINRKDGIRKAVWSKLQTLFTPEHEQQPATPTMTVSSFMTQPSLLRAFTSNRLQPDQPMSSRQHQRVRLAHRAYLRHSFNRLDFLAVVAFWISIVLSVLHLETSRHLDVFRMLSCLRIIRLLAFTSGTSVILRSLKKAAPLLVNVAFLIGFFWLLFAIVGVQSFKSSLRRSCVWIGPEGEGNYTNEFQFCGGFFDENNRKMTWLTADGQNGSTVHKGFLCPQGSLCIEGSSPYNGTVSFDNIFQSLELIFVIMTSNTFSDLLYYLSDSDYLAAALFFAAGIVILYLWLINLLIAVITSSFQVIREENKTSAFTADDRDPLLSHENDEELPRRRTSFIKKLYDQSSPLWILVILYGIVCQCLRSADMSKGREAFIDASETTVTFVLLFEIILRFIVDWRSFFKSKRNYVDLAIAIITTILQIPVIHNSGQPYAWLSIFQIIRIYRVVMAVSLTRELIMTVLGNVKGLLNLILFVFLLTFLAAIFASQMFRGELPSEDSSGEPIRVTFYSIFNSFLGMYQILSSENWTTILYNVTDNTVAFDTAWMGAAFFILWYIFANFIVLNMFIAVIQENFDVSEDEKRLQQVKAFLQQKELGGSHSNLSLSTIFKVSLATGKRRDPSAFGNATTEMLLKDAVVKDFLDQQDDPLMSPPPGEQQPDMHHPPTVVMSGTMSSIWTRFKRLFRNKEPNPFYARLEFSRAYEDLDPRQAVKEVISARERQKRAQREYLLKHPKYNVSLFLFKPNSKIRRLCQRIVGPGRGEKRIEGVHPSVPVWYAFSAFIYCAIVAMVLLACVTTPLYQKDYFKTHTFSVKNWFVFTDMGFAVLFTIEAIIKVVADGFFWTPNAYFRGSWGFIDGIVLVTLWINVATALFSEGQVSRAVGAFKALRALRLLNVSDNARNTFHSVIVQGGLKVLSAAFVSLSLLIPFAIYGLNIFHGRLQSCNDSGSGIYDLNDCVGEYMSSPYNWDVLAPRQTSNPYFNFDDFSGSLFILFQIVSQEGWTDVMWAAESITGQFTQPRPFASEGNAVFFVIFNLLGAVFVLTLFVSVFMRNYTEQTGVAYLTADQRSWLELRKLLRQVSPSKRPQSTKKRETWEEWCYRRAVRKTGRWQRFVTAVLIMHLILLCLDFYPSALGWDRAKDYIFLAFTVLYIANIVIRIIGLTWARFRKSSWDVYSIFAVAGTFITTVLLLSNFKNWLYIQLHKLCLVAIALLLIPRNNQLDQLFKTAAASLPWIANLLATWFVLFLVYAIAATQAFGLTKFNGGESDNINFRNVPKALILLFRMSVGEGWNQVMEDFASMQPPYCEVGVQFSEGDCGSADWARALFISWNILSMYIFVNLFVSLIYESFSYVYQRSSGLSVISREEIRRFKQAWAEFDPNGTGYISKEAFPRLLGELSGVFEMRIYDGDFTVARLIEDCSVSQRSSELPVEGQTAPKEIDLRKLNQRLAELPVTEIRRRRARMNKFYEEVLVSSDPDRGIGFNALLMILAHYKVINDNKSLRLKEFLRRRARLQRVDEAVRRNIVVGFFDTVYWSRQFRRQQHSKTQGRMTAVPQFTVPEIFVDDQDIGFSNSNRFSDPFMPHPGGLSSQTRNNLDTGDDYYRSGPTDGTITPPSDASARSRANSIQITPNASPTRPPLHRANTSDISGDWALAAAIGGGSPGSRPISPLQVHTGGGADGATAAGGRSRANSAVSAQDVLDVLDNSAWGESIRRSFTVRRDRSGEGGRAEERERSLSRERGE
ncbi:calcium channel-like protein subunit Cch1 [Aulographum hederae CBS 113979]|uniref:Calcium-channel protein CCH1 n=1 Tax=Aulographum hederae CBS 113979 TaxID=1176131 RepID=A0A6G1H873_9PEZI|nr:calcium channel-like protein subunit Cch1 [Aulographum hederae CBS 113979]